METAGAGRCIAITAAASIAGRLDLGLIVDRLDPRGISAVAFVMQAAALAILATSSAPCAMADCKSARQRFSRSILF